MTLRLDISRQGTDTTGGDDLITRFAERFVKDKWAGSRLPKVDFDPRGLGMNAAERAVHHAICIVVYGRTALVTSANPTPAACSRNIELGLIVRDEDIPKRIRDHFDSLVAAGTLKFLVLPDKV